MVNANSIITLTAKSEGVATWQCFVNGEGEDDGEEEEGRERGRGGGIEGEVLVAGREGRGEN